MPSVAPAARQFRPPRSRAALITRRNFGQDVPLLLQGAAPSLTAYAESGTNWGYSYLATARHRSVAHQHHDGRRAAQRRRGSGVVLRRLSPTSRQAFNRCKCSAVWEPVVPGTASFAGSVNFETTGLATRERGGEAQLQLGSFGARRGMLSYSTGLTPSRFAANARVQCATNEWLSLSLGRVRLLPDFCPPDISAIVTFSNSPRRRV